MISFFFTFLKATSRSRSAWIISSCGIGKPRTYRESRIALAAFCACWTKSAEANQGAFDSLCVSDDSSAKLLGILPRAG